LAAAALVGDSVPWAASAQQSSSASAPRCVARRFMSGDLQDLLCGALTLAGGGLPHLRAAQLRVTERQTVETLVEDFFRRGFAVLAEKESRRVHDVSVTPAIGDDAGNVPLGVEAVVTEQL